MRPGFSIRDRAAALSRPANPEFTAAMGNCEAAIVAKFSPEGVARMKADVEAMRQADEGFAVRQGRSTQNRKVAA